MLVFTIHTTVGNCLNAATVVAVNHEQLIIVQYRTALNMPLRYDKEEQVSRLLRSHGGA